MKKIILQIVLMLFCLNSFAQDWGNWVNVGHDIEVSFKFSTKGCNGYTLARIRNSSVVTKHCQIRISFTIICDGKKRAAAVSAYNLGTNEVSEKKGDWFNADKITDIKLAILSDKNCKDVLNTKSTNSGVNEIYYPKKSTNEQSYLNQKNETEQKQKIQAQQALEKQAYQNVLNAEKQQQAQQRQIAEDNKKKKYEYDEQQRIKQEQINQEKERIRQNFEIRQQSNTDVKNSMDNLVDKITEIYKADSEERYQKELQPTNSAYTSQPTKPSKVEMTFLDAENAMNKGYDLMNSGKYNEAIKEFIKIANFKEHDYTSEYLDVSISFYKGKEYLNALGIMEMYLRRNKVSKKVYFYTAQCQYQIANSDFATSDLAKSNPDQFTNYCKSWMSYKFSSDEFVGDDGIDLDVQCGEYIYNTLADIYNRSGCPSSANYCRKLAAKWKCYRLNPSSSSCDEKLLENNIPKCN